MGKYHPNNNHLQYFVYALNGTAPNLLPVQYQYYYPLHDIQVRTSLARGKHSRDRDRDGDIKNEHEGWEAEKKSR